MVEVFSVVRGLSLGGKITLALAEQTVDRLASVAMDHVAVVSLLPLMWKYRNEMSAYDSAYVALAATRGVPLVTADARLAAAAQRHCTVTLVA
jgi:predicted nucleic acid-binding protein